MSERWLLITVTADGQVNTSRHRTKDEAEIAASLARYGMTPDEMARAVAEREARIAKQKAEYVAAHPARPLTAKERQQMEKYGEPFVVNANWSNGYQTGTAYLTEDGLIQEVVWISDTSSGPYRGSDGEWADFVQGVGCVIRNRSSVKEYRIIHEAELAR